MSTPLDDVIRSIGNDYGENLQGDARHYLELNLGKEAEKRGHLDLAEKFKNAYAVVPLKSPVPGMKVRIDGRTFIQYEQFASGVAVPGYVAENAGLPHKPYTPQGSMILNFA